MFNAERTARPEQERMSPMSKTVKYAESNIDRVDWALLRRRSGAAGPHQNKALRRKRTRGAVRLSLRKEAMV
jgi:hypothetical protein